MRTSFSTNIIFLQGNIASDPESRETKNGTFILNFSLATNRSVKIDDEYEDRATFHRVVCIGKGAEWLADRIKKGHKIMVTGRQENRSYETEDGQKRYVSEVIADTVTPFLQTNNSKKSNADAAEEEYKSEEIADDVPF